MSFVCFSQPSRWYILQLQQNVSGFWKKLPIFHASKLESPTSVSHGIQRFEIHVFFPQLAWLGINTKGIDKKNATAGNGLSRSKKRPRKTVVMMNYHKISGKIPQIYICIKFDPSKIGNWITPAIMWDWILDFQKRSFQNTKSSLEAASAIKPSLLVTTSIQNHLPG